MRINSKNDALAMIDRVILSTPERDALKSYVEDLYRANHRMASRLDALGSLPEAGERAA